MSYIHAEIDSYNCMHMQTCSLSLIWKQLGGQGVLSIKESSDKENVFILHHENKLLKSKGTAWTSGSRVTSLLTTGMRKIRSGELRRMKIRYHVLLSVGCKALRVVPECLIPLRLQRRPQAWERFIQSSRLHPRTGSHPPPLHQLCLSINPLIFLSPSPFYLADFSSSCVTQCFQRWLTSPLVCVTLQSQSQTRRDGLTQSRHHSDIQLDTLFASSSNRSRFVIRNMCFRAHFAGQVIFRGSSTNYAVGFQLQTCSWSHVAHSHRKWHTFYEFSCWHF